MEKERYYSKKILKDCLFPEGLFEIKDRNCKKWSLTIEDKKNANKIVDLLNQQYARIKESEQMNSRLSQGIYWGNGEQFCDVVKKLKQENQQLKEEIRQLKFDCAMFKSANYLINHFGIDKAREIMFQSEQKLKQSQNQKAIEVLEKIKRYFDDKEENNERHGWIITNRDVMVYVDKQINELRSNNKCTR